MRNGGAAWRQGLVLITALLAGCAPIAPGGPTATPSVLPTPGPIEPEGISVRLARLQGIGPFLPTMTVYETGRLLTINEQYALVERRLTPAGIELVRQAMLDTGLFERSADYWFEVRGGAEPPGREVPVDLFKLATDDGIVEVTTVPYHDPAWMLPSPQRDALADLAERLVDLSWLPENAWRVAEPAPYAPRAFLLFGGDSPIVGEIDPAAPDLSDVAWPFPGPPEQLGGPFVSADGAQSTIDRCMVIGPGALAALSQALAAAGTPGLGRGNEVFGGAYLLWRARGIAIELQVRPLLPEEALTCVGKSQPPAIEL